MTGRMRLPPPPPLAHTLVRFLSSFFLPFPFPPRSSFSLLPSRILYNGRGRGGIQGCVQTDARYSEGLKYQTRSRLPGALVPFSLSLPSSLCLLLCFFFLLDSLSIPIILIYFSPYLCFFLFTPLELSLLLFFLRFFLSLFLFLPYSLVLSFSAVATTRQNV